MINIGFLEAEKLFPDMNCVMFHDVDKILQDDRMLMRCDDNVHHYVVTRFLQGNSEKYVKGISQYSPSSYYFTLDEVRIRFCPFKLTWHLQLAPLFRLCVTKYVHFVPKKRPPLYFSSNSLIH